MRVSAAPRSSVGLTQARLQLERGGRNLGRGLRPIREIGVCTGSAPVHAACRGHWQCQPQAATGSATGSLPVRATNLRRGPGPLLGRGGQPAHRDWQPEAATAASEHSNSSRAWPAR